VRGYGTIPTSFWPDEMPGGLKGKGKAIALACYLLSSPHSNMIGLYRLPIEYVHVDTGFSEDSIREVFRLFREEEFAFYDEPAKTVYIPSFATTQVARSLHPKDKRIAAIQRELEKIQHDEFKNKFLERYGDLYHLMPHRRGIDGASMGHSEGSKGSETGDNRGATVENQGASMGHRWGLVPVPDSVSEDKRGPGREDDGQRRPPVRRGGEPAQAGELMRMYQQTIQRK